MKKLLITTAALESGTGVLLIALPSLLASLLLGAPLDTPVGLTVARIGGAALLAIGAACWFARLDGGSRAVRGLVCALLIYNVGATGVLVFAGLVLDLSGIGLWPAVAVHAVMTAWCIWSLRKTRDPRAS